MSGSESVCVGRGMGSLGSIILSGSLGDPVSNWLSGPTIVGADSGAAHAIGSTFISVAVVFSSGSKLTISVTLLLGADEVA